MKLHILSDLHLEFDDLDLPRTDADVVILAGDIALGTDGVRFAAQRFRQQPVIYVLGNHENYHRAMNEVWDDIRQYTAPHVHVLENQSLTIGGVRFLGCTLWTDFGLFGPDRLTASLEAARTYHGRFQSDPRSPGQRVYLGSLHGDARPEPGISGIRTGQAPFRADCGGDAPSAVLGKHRPQIQRRRTDTGVRQ
jgi:hypothetical protein